VRFGLGDWFGSEHRGGWEGDGALGAHFDGR
jgi:hypothetical protein